MFSYISPFPLRCLQVAKGQAAPAQLAQEQKRLNEMQQELVSLEDEADATASTADNLLKFLGLGPKKQQQPAAAGAVAGERAPTGSKGEKRKAGSDGAVVGGSSGSSGSMSGVKEAAQPNKLVKVGCGVK